MKTIELKTQNSRNLKSSLFRSRIHLRKRLRVLSSIGWIALLGLGASGCDTTGFDLATQPLTIGSSLGGSTSGSGASQIFAFSSAMGNLLPSASRGGLYSLFFSTDYSSNPVTFSLQTDSTLPTGLQLSATGALSGRVTAPVGYYEFVIAATEAGQDPVQKRFSLTVSPAFGLLANGLPIADLNSFYTSSLGVTGGTAPYQYSATGLPPGLTLENSTGLIKGTPTQIGNFTLAIQVTDAFGNNDAGTLNLTVVTPSSSSLSIQTASPLGAGTLGNSYVQVISIQGGVYPYRFTLTGATNLPAGLSLDPDLGTITGTPAQSGIVSVTIRVTDALQSSASKDFTLIIAPPPGPTILTNSLGTATVGSSYVQVITAASNATPLTFSISSGSLPNGLSLSDVRSGIISGSPTAITGQTQTFAFTVAVRDAFNTTSTKNLQIVVVAPPAPVIQTLSLPAATVGTAYTVPIRVTSGLPPYSFSVTAGSKPAWLNLSGTSGILSGTPSGSTGLGGVSFTVSVTDGVSVPVTQEYNLVVNSPARATIANATLASGQVGATYYQQLSSSGGALPYSYSISGALPTGITFNSTTGVFSGTPAANTATSYPISVTVTDQNGNGTASVPKSFLLTISEAAAPQITNSSLLPGSVGTPYSDTLVGTSGSPPYTFLRTSGTLPTGLTLDANSGGISGTPVGSAATVNLTFKITDNAGNYSTKILPIQIIAANPPSISTVALADAGVGISYAQLISVLPGIPPYRFATTAGSLPTGLTMSSTTGIIFGSPTTPQTSTFTIQVTDSVNVTASQTLSLKVTAASPPQISTPSLATGTAGVFYMQSLATSGGKAPIIVSLTNPLNLPGGITFNSSTLSLSGTPQTGGSASLIFQIIDSLGLSSNITYQLQIQAAAPPTISTASLAGATQGVNYAQVIGVSGGSSPYTFSLASGSALPDGLTLNSSNGTITGTPTGTAASSSFTISVSDSIGGYTSKGLSITVNPATPPTWVTTTLPTGTVNTSYTTYLIAKNGLPSYLYTLASGALPSGLSLNTSIGSISGTINASANPGASPTPYAFSIQVTDSAAHSSSQSFTLTVNPSLFASLAFDTSVPLLPVIVNANETRTLLARGGLPPYTYAISSGTLPTGLSLNASTGVLSGTPTVTGLNTFTAWVRDQNSNTTTQNYTLKVSTGLNIANTTLSSGVINAAYATTVSATGGSGYYTFSATGLPTGLNMSNAGVISGITMSTGTATPRIQVTDSDGLTTSQSFSLTINTSLSITTATLPVANVNRLYNGVAGGVTVQASGGTSPLTYSLLSGALPPGLSINTSSGAITGTVQANTSAVVQGSSTFTILVADATGQTANRTYTVSVTIPPSVMDEISNPLRPARNGGATAYTEVVNTSGGYGKITFTATGLPTGLSIDATSGYITGMTTATAGTYNVNITATDAKGSTGTRTKKIKVVSSGKSTIQFDTPVATSMITASSSNSIVEAGTGDLNGDGLTDIVTHDLGGTGGIQVGIAKGDGSFTRTYYSLDAASGYPGRTPVIVDLDQDGCNDVVILEGNGAASGNQVEVLKGDCTWNGLSTMTRQKINFGTQASYNSAGIAAADVNGDGVPDLVLTDYNINTVRVIVNCTSKKVGAVNGSQVLTTNYNGNASTTCSNNSSNPVINYHYVNSTYNGTTGSNYTQTQAHGIAIADMTGDSIPDLIVLPYSTQSLFIFRGNATLGIANGTFSITPFVSYNNSAIPNNNKAAIRSTADLNGDGKADIVMDGPDGPYVAFGTGNATGFSNVQGLSSTSDVGTSGSGYMSVVRDINGDGCPDIVSIALYFNNGSCYWTNRGLTQIWYNTKTSTCTGSFGGKRYINSGSASVGVNVGRFYTSTSPSGPLDLVEVGQNGGQNWQVGRWMTWKNNGAATGYPSFSSVFSAGGSSTGPLFFAAQPSFDNALKGAPVVGDLNNDGAPDFIGKLGASASIYLGSSASSGTFTPASALVNTGEMSAQWWNQQQLALADFNGDGYLDLVSGNYNNNSFGSTAVYLGAGDGTFSSEFLFSTDLSGCTSNGAVYSVASGDFNQDGKMDLVVGHSCNNIARVSVYFGNGDGTFNTSTPIILAPNNNYAAALAVADVNKDGNLDIAVATSGGWLHVFLGNGNGSFQNPNSSYVGNIGGSGNQWLASSLELGDINGDGYLDYLYVPYQGIYLALFQGASGGTISGNYTPLYGLDYLNSSTAFWFRAGKIADMDQDGILDVVGFKYQSGAQIYKGTGSTTVGAGSFTVGLPVVQMANIACSQHPAPVIADFNGDGLLDWLNASPDGTNNSSYGLTLNLSN